MGVMNGSSIQTQVYGRVATTSSYSYILTKSLGQGVPVDVIYMDLQKVLILCCTKVYYNIIRLNIMELQATFSDRLLDFYLIGGMQCVVLNGKNLVGKMLRAAFLKDQF